MLAPSVDGIASTAASSCFSSFWEMYSPAEINSSVDMASSKGLIEVKLVMMESVHQRREYGIQMMCFCVCLFTGEEKVRLKLDIDMSD